MTNPNQNPPSDPLQALQKTLDDLQTNSPYSAFGLKPGCGKRAVEDAFLALVPKHHPDRFAHLRSDAVNQLANLVFLELSQARARLINSEPSDAPAPPPQTSPKTAAPAPTAPQPAPQFAARPATQPVTQPPAQPVARPATQPVARPMTQPVARPMTQPVARPATLPPPPSAPPPPAALPEEPQPQARSLPTFQAPSAPQRAPQTQPSMPVFTAPPASPSTPQRPPAAATSAPAAADARPQPPRDPVTASRYYKQGLKFLKAEQYESARGDFAHAVGADPDNALYACYLAWSEFLCTPARPELSSRRLRQTVLKPEAAEMSSFFLGKIAQHTKQDDEAAQHFHAVLKINPKNLDAQSELRLLKQRRNEDSSFGARIAGFFKRLGGG